ncbi:MAG: ATP synthase subunit delta [Chloroflexi bacterium ADurb.Bin325]|nr:MAG: ATP synthase subunit delta [Chloroflexi bacterium ADurb.Bin325]
MNAADRAQNYANAFFEAAFERWLTSLGEAAGALEGNRALLPRLQAEDVDFKDRQALLEGVLPADMDALVRNLLSLLLQRGDLGLLHEVMAALRQRLQLGGAGPVPVTVTTAVPLAEDLRAALEARLAQEYGENLVYTYHVDAAILGGVIVRVGDKLMDGSVATRLAAMRQTLGVTVQE